MSKRWRWNGRHVEQRPVRTGWYSSCPRCGHRVEAYDPEQSGGCLGCGSVWTLEYLLLVSPDYGRFVEELVF